MNWYNIIAAIFVTGCAAGIMIFRDVILGKGNSIIDADPFATTIYDEMWETKKDREVEYAGLKLVPPLPPPPPSRLYDQEIDGYI